MARGHRKILDLGCGTGRHTLYLAQCSIGDCPSVVGLSPSPEVWGVDTSEVALQITREKATKLGLDINLQQQDMRSLSFADDSFDALLCIWTTGHGLLTDLQQSVAEMRRVLHPGGLLVADFCSTDDETYGVGETLEEHTFVGGRPGEEEIPHHYSTLAELQQLFASFATTKIEPVDYTYQIGNDPHLIKAFLVQAEK